MVNWHMFYCSNVRLPILRVRVWGEGVGCVIDRIEGVGVRRLP